LVWNQGEVIAEKKVDTKKESAVPPPKNKPTKTPQKTPPTQTKKKKNTPPTNQKGGVPGKYKGFRARKFYGTS